MHSLAQDLLQVNNLALPFPLDSPLKGHTQYTQNPL